VRVESRAKNRCGPGALVGYKIKINNEYSMIVSDSILACHELPKASWISFREQWVAARAYPASSADNCHYLVLLAFHNNYKDISPRPCLDQRCSLALVHIRCQPIAQQECKPACNTQPKSYNLGSLPPVTVTQVNVQTPKMRTWHILCLDL
jgi:hypothetical protein